jgi:hypothetical protein
MMVENVVISALACWLGFLEHARMHQIFREQKAKESPRRKAGAKIMSISIQP